jgi:hypothetical protein
MLVSSAYFSKMLTNDIGLRSLSRKMYKVGPMPELHQYTSVDLFRLKKLAAFIEFYDLEGIK